MTALTLIPLCNAADVAPGGIRQAMLDSGHLLAIFNVNGQWFVTDDTCTHGAASLSEEGALCGHLVECGWHSGGFDVRSGQASAMPCTEPLRSWPVQVVDGQICVVDTGAPSAA